jgi:hypothetical protein
VDWTEASRPESVDDPSAHAQYRAADLVPGVAAGPLSMPSEAGVRTPGMVDQARERLLRTVVIPAVVGVMVASLLLVLVGSTGLVPRLMGGQEEPLPALLEVGSCFIVDEAGRVRPERCSARNDGDVLAEVVDPETCELLAEATSVPFAVVEGRTFCLADRADDR